MSGSRATSTLCSSPCTAWSPCRASRAPAERERAERLREALRAAEARVPAPSALGYDSDLAARTIYISVQLGMAVEYLVRSVADPDYKPEL